MFLIDATNSVDRVGRALWGGCKVWSERVECRKVSGAYVMSFLDAGNWARKHFANHQDAAQELVVRAGFETLNIAID